MYLDIQSDGGQDECRHDTDDENSADDVMNSCVVHGTYSDVGREITETCHVS